MKYFVPLTVVIINTFFFLLFIKFIPYKIIPTTYTLFMTI